MTSSKMSVISHQQTDQPATPLAASWGPVRRELFPLSWVLMDVALITPLALSLLRWARYWPAGHVAFLILLLLLLPYNLIRLMSLLNWPKQRQQRVLTAVLLLLLYITLRTLLHGSLLDFRWLGQIGTTLRQSRGSFWLRDVGLFLLIAVAWSRGQAMVERQPDINAMGLKLRVGGLLFTPLVIWLATVRLLFTMAPFVLLYFLAALTAVSLIRAEQIEQERTGLSAAVTPRWFGGIVIASLLVVLTAALFTLIVSGNTPFLLIAWLNPLWDALSQLGTVAFVTASYLAFPLLGRLSILLEWLARLIQLVVTPLLALLRGVDIQSQSLPPTQPLLTFNDFVELTNQLHPSVKLGLLLIPLGAVLLISLFLGRLARLGTAQRHSQRTGGRLTDDDDDEPGLAERLLSRLGMLRHWRTAVSIRRIYRQMCRAAAGAGYPRAETQTPYEYLPVLAQVWPGHEADAAQVTQAFVRVRYGEVPEDPAELNAIRAAWERLERTPPLSREEAVALPHLQNRTEN